MKKYYENYEYSYKLILDQNYNSSPESTKAVKDFNNNEIKQFITKKNWIDEITKKKNYYRNRLMLRKIFIINICESQDRNKKKSDQQPLPYRFFQKHDPIIFTLLRSFRFCLLLLFPCVISH